MKLRVPKSLHRRLQLASKRYETKLPAMFEKALKKFGRLADQDMDAAAAILHTEPVAFSQIPQIATHKTTVISVPIHDYLIEGLIASDIRKIIVWYLEDQDAKDTTPRFTPKKSERRYTIKSVS